MLIRDMFRVKRPTISFEVFPPKKDGSLEKIFETIEELKDLKPDFISVTYGAGGTTKDTTVNIASKIKNDFGIETIAHLTCVTSSSSEIDGILDELKANNIENVLALRGDIPKELDNSGWNPEFKYAFELIELIKKRGDFSIGGACYPEGHTESKSKVDDLHNLKYKVEKGADFLISQLFFDNELFYDFREKIDIMGLKVPIIAGILPVLNINQITRIQELSGCSLPKKFLRIINKYEHNPKALEEAGIVYALEQIIDLLSWGIEGVHIYTMNRPDATRKIMNSISQIRKTLDV